VDNVPKSLKQLPSQNLIIPEAPLYPALKGGALGEQTGQRAKMLRKLLFSW